MLLIQMPGGVRFDELFRAQQHRRDQKAAQDEEEAHPDQSDARIHLPKMVKQNRQHSHASQAIQLRLVTNGFHRRPFSSAVMRYSDGASDRSRCSIGMLHTNSGRTAEQRSV